MEVLNKGSENHLSCFASYKPTSWSKCLWWVEYRSNASFHTSIKMRPFKVINSGDPLVIMRYGTPKSPIDKLDVNLKERDHALSLLKEQLGMVQVTMKSYKDKGCQDVQLAVGDMVYVKMRPHRMKALSSTCMHWRGGLSHGFANRLPHTPNLSHI